MDVYSNYELSNLQISTSSVLNVPNSTLLETFNIPNNEIIFQESYRYCFRANITTTDGLLINVVDVEGRTLATDYLLTKNGENCLLLENNNLFREQIIGIKCVNCNATETIIFYEDLMASDKEKILNDIVSLDDPLATKIEALKNCKYFSKELSKWWLKFNGLMLFVILIISGIDWMKGGLDDL